MKNVTYIDRGVDEMIKINGKSIRVDKLSARQLLECLKRENCLELTTVTFDEYEKNKDTYV